MDRLPTAEATPEDLVILLERLPSTIVGPTLVADFNDGRAMYERELAKSQTRVAA